MIVLEKVTAANSASGRSSTILSSINLVIPTDRRIALIGPSLEEKKILINLFAGLVLPRAGRIIRKAKVSFPVGHLGGFTADLPVRINVAHLARLYDVDAETVVDFVESVSGLGTSFNEPYGQLSSVAKRHLGRIVAFSIPFDLYLLTEEVARGNTKQGDVLYRLFEARTREAGVIMPTNNPQFARDNCDMALVLKGGRLSIHDDIDRAFAILKRRSER